MLPSWVPGQSESTGLHRLTSNLDQKKRSGHMDVVEPYCPTFIEVSKPLLNAVNAPDVRLHQDHRWHDFGCHDYQCARLDQARDRQAQPRGAPCGQRSGYARSTASVARQGNAI